MRNKRIVYALLAVVVIAGVVFAGRGLWPAPGPAPQPTPPPTPSRPDLPQDSVAPIIIQRTPATGEELPPDGSVELIFARPMDKASVEGAFSLVEYKTSGAVKGQFSWINDRTLRFVPAQPLPRDGVYRALLGANARDAQGSAAGDASAFTVKVVGYLEVAQVLPKPGAQDVDPAGTITVIFNRPVVPLTTIAEQANLPQPLSITPDLPGKGEWLNTAIYQFTPDQPLRGGATYTVRVAAGLVDTVGTPLAADYTWTFSTTPPTVAWTTPNDQAVQISPAAPITVTFNQAIDAASAAAAFSLHTGVANIFQVQGSTAVSGTTLIFTPAARLDFGATYTVEIAAGVQSAGGGQGMLQPYRWSFTTSPLPRILSTTPGDGDHKAYPYTDFSIEFSAPIRPETVMPNLAFSPPLSPTQVYTYFSPYDNRFTITFGAQPSTDYEVRISPNISDPFGNLTGQSLTVRFRTADLDPAAQILLPDVIGTLSGYDPARMVVAHVNVPRLDLRLVRLDPAQLPLASEYAWNQSGLPDGQEVRRWSLDVTSKLNETAYTPVDLTPGAGALEPGMYLLTLDAPGLSSDYYWGRRFVLIVSNVNLTIKQAPDALYVWATDLQSGAPVAGLSLAAYAYPNNQPALRASAVTDAQGVARFDLKSDAYDGGIFVLNASGETRFAAGSVGWSSGISPWDFNLPAGYGQQPYNLHLVTDRPIYRPGQTVYFRGVLRGDDDAHYSLPAGVTNVTVAVSAPDGSATYNKVLALGAYGTFNDHIDLASGAALGQYNANISFRDAQGHDYNFGQSFTVAAYRAPEFSVTLTPASSAIVSGTATTAVASVKYFFGGPVADKDLTWNVLATPFYFDLPGAGGYSFSDDGDPYAYMWRRWCGPEMGCSGAYPGTPVLSGSGRTDKQGNFTIDLPANLMQLASATGSMQFSIEATVNGADGQVISGRNTLTVHQADFYVGTRAGSYVARAGDPVAADVLVAGWDGTRRAGVTVQLEFVRTEWINKFVESQSGQGGYWTWEQKDTVEGAATVVTDAAGQATTTFTPSAGGSYRIRSRALDGGGRPAASSTFVWVTGPEAVTWRQDNSDRITLVTDKTTYQPGETASIFVPSPFQGRQYAWVTVERGHVLRQEVIAFDGSTFTYQLPIPADYAPNVYVSVVLIKGQDASNKYPAHKVGYALIDVDTQAQALNVEVHPQTDKVEPGKEAQFDVFVRDGNGQPVQGEFSFDLVDKAVLSLLPRSDNAILQAFYGQRALSVQTASGLTLSINRLVEAQLQDVQTRDQRSGGETGNGVPAEEPVPASAPTAAPAGTVLDKAADGEYAALPPGVEVRENFADTAYWNPSFVTDAGGHAVLAITLPDNLTTWVLRGVGVTLDTKVGEGLGEVIATRPLLVRPVTPRFFVVDDRVQLAALVSNNTDTALDVQVALNADGVSIDGAATQTINVPAGGEGKVTWTVTVSDVRYAGLTFIATSGAYADASKPRLATGPDGTIPVLRYTAPDIVGTAGYLDTDGSRVEIVALPPNYDDRRGGLTIQLDPSLAAGMTEGLTYLEHYEYECTEQTVSRFLPNVLTYKALHDLNIKDPELEARLPDLVQQGLDKLYTQQHDDGGWGWWSPDRSDAYLSCYVVRALLRARAGGSGGPHDVVERGLAYVSGTLAGAQDLNDRTTANRQAFILYVFSEAGRADNARLQDLFDHRAKLGRYGQAFLALAIGLRDAKDARVTTLLSDLSGSAIVSATGAHWEEDSVDWWAMNTNVRSTAVVLDAFARLDPQNQINPNVVRWLMVARKAGVWSTTQENAWALIGLTDWMAATGELAANYSYSVTLNGTDLTSGQATAENVRQSVRLDVAITDLVRDVGNQLVITRGDGAGRLYYTAHLQVYQPVPDIPAANRGFVVARRYVRADCTDGPKCPEVTSAKVGDVIRVELTIVTPNDRYYVSIEDPLPAGAEGIDTTLATTSQTAEGANVSSTGCWEGDWGNCWWWNWWTRAEMRDDKVALFSTYLNSGSYTYSYTFRATLPGEYRVIPTVAQEMYFPEVFGRSSGGLFTITP
jgi:uncharacterized protein YfaS (alpha-2-macroglobulin family)